MATFNRNEFASLVGVSPRQVSDWMDEGMPCQRSGKKGEQVQIESAPAFQWLMKRNDGEIASARLRKAQADRAEFENRVRRGEFISVELFGETLLALAGEVAGQMSGFPGRVAGKIAGVQDAGTVRSRLMDECNVVRSAFAAHLREIAGIAERVRAEMTEQN